MATERPAILVRAAAAGEAGVLSDVAHRSKGYWDYPADLLADWSDELSLSEEDIRSMTVLVATANDTISGFCALDRGDEAWSLEHFWILPEYIGHGHGRVLLAKARQVARAAGATSIEIDADPNAEKFYVQCGAVRIGERAAPIPGDPQRIRPLLVLRCDGD